MKLASLAFYSTRLQLSDDRLLVKLLPSTVPQREIRIMTGRREH